MTSKPSFDFLDAPRQKLHAAALDQREAGLQPDDAAETWRLGEAQGLEPELALRNAADVRAEAERQRLDKLTVDAPAVADWIAAKPERLAIARDDLETMGLFEKMYRNLVPADAGTRYVDTTMRAPASGFLGYGGQVMTGLGDLNDAAARSIERGIRGVGADGLADALAAPVLPWWLNPSEIVRRPGQDLRDVAGDIGVPDERQNFATDVTGGVGQLGGMTAQAIFAPQTSLPSLFALGASQQADEARAAGQLGTPEADAAVLLGAPTTAALERFGIEKLLNRVPPKFKSKLGRWAADKAMAFGYEGGQEIVEGVTQDVIGKATFDPERNIGEGLTYEAIVAGTSAGFVRTLLGVRSPLRPVVESADDVVKIEQLHELGGQLKTLDRNPAEVEALVRGIADRNPDAPTHVYLDAEQLVTYFQSANLDPALEIGRLTGDPDGASLAAAAGGDIVVPIERYVARGVKSVHADALKGMARLRADGASNAELEGLDVDTLFADIAPDTSAAAERADPDAPQALDPVAEVAGAVRVQLEASGVEPSAAAAQAEHLAKRYATRAERRGKGESPLQVYEAAQLAVRSATPGDVQRRTRPGQVDAATDSVLDALRTQAGPSDFDTFGPSLVEVLAERGGIRDEVMTGEIRSLAESDGARYKAILAKVGGKRPKASKAAKAYKPLVPGDGTGKMDLDRAVEAALESGFLREGESITELVEALMDELVAERPRYSENNRNPDLMAMRESMRALDEVLSEQGIDINTLSNAEVRAALARAYEQPAYHGTPHSVDKFSLQKIGTGEGAQAYGWGLYFASQREIAEHYRDMLTRDVDMDDGVLAEALFDALLPTSTFPDAVAVGSLQTKYDRAEFLEAWEEGDITAADFSPALLSKAEASLRGNLYKVEVPDDGDLLDYDKPLSEQPAKVREAVESLMKPDAGFIEYWTGTLLADYAENGPDSRGYPEARVREVIDAALTHGEYSEKFGTSIWDEINEFAPESGPEFVEVLKRQPASLSPEDTGKQVYEVLAASKGEKAASEALLSVGIPGLRYNDATSRGGKADTHNYVIWDESAIGTPERVLFQDGPAGSPSDEDKAAQVRGRRVLRGITRDSTAAEIDKTLAALEGIKVRLRDLPAEAPASSATPDPDSTAGVGAFWSALAGADGIFSYPKPAEGVTGIQEIADVIAPGFKMEQGAEGPDGVTQFTVKTPLGKEGKFELEPGGHLQLHISDFEQGSAEGQQFYAIFNTWAARNGLRALPDRQGLSPVNKYRRTENMLSSALRDGQTSHLSPADVQGLPHWRAGDFGAEPSAQDQAFNVGYLAIKSAETTLKSAPLLDRVRFDFEARQFQDSKGREITDADFDALSSQLQAGKIGVGRRSLKRAVVTVSAVRALHGSGLDSDRAAQLGLAARASVGSELQGDDAGGVLDKTLYQPADGGAPRGRIVLGRNGERTIELLKGANLSTFHHETGHLFLDELVEDAFTPGTPDGLRADLDLLFKDWGLETRAADGKDAVMAAIKVDQHEKFARGYEAYLFEGKAPAPGLADLMARFRTWMIAVYKQISALNVKLSPEVRGVYARLLATDDQIAAAEQSAGFTPLAIPTDVQALLPAGQWAKYEGMLAAATVEARQSVEQRLLAAQQREAKAWWRDRRAEIRETVQAEAYARPDFIALSILSRNKMPDGSDPPEGMAGLTLSRKRLVELYGESFVKDTLAPLRVVRKGVRIVPVKAAGPFDEAPKSDGMSPSAAAAVLGFPDGGALVDALANAPKLKDWVNGETDARMREQYPDPLLDGSLPAEAMAAVHNDKRLQALEYELSLLAVVAGQPVMKARVLGAAARQRIAGMKRRDIRPNDYLVAERKAARLATKAAAAGNYAEALRRKREQTLSAHLYKAAQDATAEFDKAREYLGKFNRTDTRARLGKAGGSYLEQIDGLLELVEVRNVSGRDVERRQTLADWVERRAAEGESIDVPDAVLALTRLTNLRDMPMEQIRGLVDTVKQIDHLARLKTELLLGKERRDRAEVDAEMAASVRGARGDTPENKGDRTMGERARDAVNQGLGAYLRPSTLARDLDGFENSGAVWTHTVGIVQDAINNQLNPALQQGQEALAGIWRKHYTDAELRQVNTAVSRGPLGSWSKGRILSLALNWGNVGNREALLSQARKRLAPAQIGQLLGTLDARDVAFLNEVWAHVDSYWPAIADAQKRRTGLVPEKVEASPFTITLVDGTTAELAGGYFPLKYESEGDPKANQDEQTEFWDAIRTGRFTKAQTKNGHTKERVGSGGRTVRLDVSVLGSHVRDVLRDVHLGDAVNYVHKTLQGPEFRSALSDVGKLEYARALDLWLRDVATGEMAPRTFFERVGRKMRTNFTASLLGFNVSSALIQPTGFLQSGASLGWGTLGTGLQRLISSPWVGPNSVGVAVDRVSPMMANRSQVSVEAVRKAEKALAGQRDSYVMRHAWAMMARTQRIVDLATWLGAEAKGMDEFGGDVAKARAYADDAVQRAQASGEFSDKSALERGTFGDNVRQSELLRGSTALMSYMIAKGNVVYERTRQTSFRNPAQVGRLAVDLTSLLVIENLLIAVLRGGLPSDEEEDGIADDAAAWFVKEGALGLLSTIPIVSQSATTLRGYDAKGVIERLSTTGKRVTDALWDYAGEDEPLTTADFKAGVSLLGMLTGLPAAQTNRMLDAYLSSQEGEEVAAHEFLIGKRKE